MCAVQKLLPIDFPDCLNIGRVFGQIGNFDA